MRKEIEVKRILNRSKHPSGWFGVVYNMNIYRGCQHGCIYCDSRSECYRIENFDDITIKINAPKLLDKELRSKRKKGTIGTGSMSDPYIPLEKEYELTRQCLEIIGKFRFPVHITTKSNLILRDIKILKKINELYASVAITITTTDDILAKKIEPNAPLPSDRLEALSILSSVGIRTGIVMMPLLPYIQDSKDNIVKIVEKAKECGVGFIVPSFGMTLRDRQRAYYYKELDKHFPGLREKYERKYKNYYSCGCNNYSLLKKVFYEKCLSNGIKTTMPSYSQENTMTQISFLR